MLTVKWQKLCDLEPVVVMVGCGNESPVRVLDGGYGGVDHVTRRGNCSELPEPYQTYMSLFGQFKFYIAVSFAYKEEFFFFNYFRSIIFEIIFDNLKVVKELLRDTIVEAILCKFVYIICIDLIIFT